MSNYYRYKELVESEDKLNNWIGNIINGLYTLFLNDTDTDIDIRNAALYAIRALTYLATKPEEIKIITKRPSWKEFLERYKEIENE